MTRNKILYVDDEAMALKYFERLVSPLAPVLTATSVDEGRALLDAHAGEIAVLVSDQRMPGARGNELLRHARERHPAVVRMLTTAYSDIGEAIEAINSGEIYRYIAKPWELEHLRADLRNALELAALRAERDGLLREKLMVEQARLLGQRIAQLTAVAAALGRGGHEAAVHAYVRAALAAGAASPAVDWRRWDYAELLSAEGERAVQLVDQVRQWWALWGAPPAGGDERLGVLANALGLSASGGSLALPGPAVLTAVLGAEPGSAIGAADSACLAWLLWVEGAAQLRVAGAHIDVVPAEAQAPRRGWLADAIEAAVPQAA
ncbi:response regulator [Hydrogenophaga crocea]|uniref:Response regulator n=1 Tax=Hydrogenophaga crocea TaxID=2716225 RepID=A0A6G8IIY0_9BURK|nr:response regulator [Hydrogenophaga crocea]QIM53069.1 response regulator [Hydrogenophaga crocea]